MASPLEAIVVRFGAEWTGGAAVNRVVSDINRIVSTGKQAGDMLSMTKMLTGIESHDKAIANSAVALGQWQANLKMVHSSINSIGTELATGAITQEEAASRYLQLGRAAKEIEQEISNAVPAVKGFGASIAGITPQIIAVGAAVTVAVKAFQAWRDAAEMGAVIRQTGESFDFLSKNIYQVPDLLNQMREASRGTISDMQLMSSFMTLVAGTTPELGSALAAATPQLLEIAKAANTLNPTLGDTTFFFESLARGIKRSEIRLIDNLGLNLRIGEANKRWAEQLGKTVQELTAEERQMAILNETIRVGTNLVDQLGGSIESLTDPYLKWAAQTENIKNNLRELASITFAPLINEAAAASGVWAEFMQNIIDSRKHMEEFRRKQDQLANSVGDGATKAEQFTFKMQQGFMNLVPEILKTYTYVGQLVRIFEIGTSSAAQFNYIIERIKAGDSLRDIFFEGDALSAPMGNAVKAANDLSVALGGVTAAGMSVPGVLNRIERASIGSTKGMDSSRADVMAEAFRRLQFYAEGYRKTMENSAGAGNTFAEGAAKIARNLELQASAHDRAAAAAERYAEAAAAAKESQSQAWMDIFAGGNFNSELVVGDIRNIGTAWVTTSSATAEQAEQLADLNKEMEKAKDKLWDMENGIGVQGDKAENTAKKISDLRDEIANYESAIAGMQQGITATSSQKDFGLNINNLEAYKQFITMMGEWDAPVDQLSAVAQGLGLISPAAADAMLKMTLLQGAMDNLNLKLKTGQIDASEIPEAIQGVIAALEQDKTYGEIVLDLQVKAQVHADQVKRQAQAELSAVRDEYGNVLDMGVGADLTAAEKSMLGWLGMVEGEKPTVQVEADDKAARDTVNTLTSDIEKANPVLSIYGKYIPDPKAPTGTPGGGVPSVPGAPYQPFATGGYIAGQKGRERVIRAHAGEFVLRPEAVDRLGLGFLSALNRGNVGSQSNSVTVQSNFYAPVGSSEVREVVLRSADDGAKQIADILARGGYKLR